MRLQTIEEKMDEFVSYSPQNRVDELGIRMWDKPMVAVADVGDPLWEKLKEPQVVGSRHLSPTAWLSGAKAVIAYFLPYTLQVRSSNYSRRWPSKEWLYGRYEGEMFNRALLKFIVDLVETAGGRALAPALDDRFAVLDHRSNWSERHVAFIAGLGTFSLNRSLITERGSAGRLGSVIVDLDLEPSRRLYQEVDEYCTKCGACIKRCPAHAVDKSGKDNKICSRYLDEVLERYRPRYGCGKCQTAVPCEDKKPKQQRKSI